MCCPLGHRSSRSSSSRLCKRDVKEMIESGEYECFYRTGDSKTNVPYEGSKDELLRILRDSSTVVKSASRMSEDYMEGYHTAIMRAYSIDTVYLLRTERG